MQPVLALRHGAAEWPSTPEEQRPNKELKLTSLTWHDGFRLQLKTRGADYRTGRQGMGLSRTTIGEPSSTRASRTAVWFLTSLVVAAAAYGLLALALLRPVHDQSWAWNTFRAFHLVLTGTGAVLAARRGSLALRLVLVIVTLAVSMYSFMFVWFNVWGT